MIRAPIAGLAAGEHELPAATARYLVRVLRLRRGDPFVAFDPAAAREADARVEVVENDRVRVVVGALRAASVLPAREVTWIQALAKGDKCDAVVRDATELGATRIVVCGAARSVVRLDAGRATARAERWRRIVQEAARQCGRGDVPVVDFVHTLGDALGAVAEPAARFFLFERATEPLGPMLFDALAARAPLAFAAGPEGGFEDAEVDDARARGWQIASLGALTLRAETVAAAVLGAAAVWG